MNKLFLRIAKTNALIFKNHGLLMVLGCLVPIFAIGFFCTLWNQPKKPSYFICTSLSVGPYFSNERTQPEAR